MRVVILLLFMQTMLVGMDSRFSVFGVSLQDQVSYFEGNATNPLYYGEVAGNIVSVPFTLMTIMPSEVGVLLVLPLVILIMIGAYKLIRSGKG